MKEELVRAAEREMRRPAPDVHRKKQRKLDDTPGYSFKELGRFDYRAAGAIAEGSQGFIVTCHFRREKSATREAMEALQGSVREVSPAAPDVAFSIVKLPCRGVILLQWQPAGTNLESSSGGSQRPALPPPADVVAHLIWRIESGKRARLTHAQRISPIQTTCAATETHLREAVLRMASQHAAALGMQSNGTTAPPQQQSAQDSADGHKHESPTSEPVQTAQPAGSNVQEKESEQESAAGEVEASARRLRFAIAFRSRAAEPAAAAAAAAAGTPSDGGAAMPSNGAAAGSAANVNVQGPLSAPKASGDSGEAVASPEQQSGNGSSSEANGAAAAISSKRPREQGTCTGEKQEEQANGAGIAGSKESENSEGQVEAGNLSRERGIAVAAAAFAEGMAQGKAEAVVDLKKPDWVLNVDAMPVGGRCICALGLVSAESVTLRPKLTMKQIGS